MTVVQTSILAFERITPTLQERESMVFEAVRQLGVASNMEIARQLGWSVNRVTGRTYSLRAKGILADAGVFACEVTGCSVHKWALTKNYGGEATWVSKHTSLSNC